MSNEDTKKRIDDFKRDVNGLKSEISTVIVGNEQVVEQLLVCILANGHALLEGVPGLGKTLMVKTLSQCLNLTFSRIQFTPDLMPADIIGTNIITETEGGKKAFQFQRGPIFGNIILADEINRATPKTQSAMLEAMQECTVTVAGTKYELPRPFFVIATQNPIEMEGTYPLPEAQLDRFFLKILVSPPDLNQLLSVMDRTTGESAARPQSKLSAEQIISMGQLIRQVPVASHVMNYAARLTLATHPNTGASANVAKKYIRYGASPRAAQAIILSSKVLALLNDRYNVSFEDIRKTAYPALRHRIILNFEAEAEGISQDAIIGELLKEVPEML